MWDVECVRKREWKCHHWDISANDKDQSMILYILNLCIVPCLSKMLLPTLYQFIRKTSLSDLPNIFTQIQQTLKPWLFFQNASLLQKTTWTLTWIYNPWPLHSQISTRACPSYISCRYRHKRSMFVHPVLAYPIGWIVQYYRTMHRGLRLPYGLDHPASIWRRRVVVPHKSPFWRRQRYWERRLDNPIGQWRAVGIFGRPDGTDFRRRPIGSR